MMIKVINISKNLGHFTSDTHKLFKINVYISVLALLISLFSVQISLGYIMIRNSYLSETRQVLESLEDRILADIDYKDGNWNVDRYLSDPLTPHPQGSSGFSRPLYIIDTDGFIIERNLPIKGYLDSSDFSHLMKYSTSPSNFNRAGEKWRILSKPIIFNKEVQGVVVVGIYEPNGNTSVVDRELVTISQILLDALTFENNEIYIHSVDIRNVKFNVSFEIVNKYNKVLLNNGRIPSFIDKSYVYDILPLKEKRVQDNITGEEFLVRFKRYIDINGNPQAIVVIGESLTGLSRSLRKYLLSSSFLSIIILIPLSFVLYKQILMLILRYEEIKKKGRSFPRKLSFERKTGILTIDDVTINIPYASNQYYLISSLFESPKKRWETDQLIDRMGESAETVNTRTLYDASLALNKKVSFKLIIYNRKTYYLNPEIYFLLK